MVVEPAERDDHIFAAHPFGEIAFEHDLNSARNLPPEFTRGPNSGRVGANDRRAYGPKRTIHVGVRVRCNYEGARRDIAALDHDLVSNAGAGWIEVHRVRGGEGFDRAILPLIGFVVILNIVIKREYQLFGVVDSRRTDTFELAHHCRGIVVRQDMEGANGNEVAGAQRPAGSCGQVGLRDFFDNCLGHRTPSA